MPYNISLFNMKKKSDVTLKEYAKISLWSMKISWGISKSATILSLICEILRNLRGLIDTYVIARLIDKLLLLISNDGSTVADLIPFLVILLGIDVFFSGVGELRAYSSRVIRRLSNSYLNKMEYEKINYLGVQTLEYPDVANALQKVNDWLGYVTEVGNSVVRIIASVVKIFVSGAIIASVVPIVIPMILVASIVFYLQRRYFFKKEFEWQTNDDHLTRRRRSNWMASELSDAKTIGEISIIGAYKFLDRKFTDFFNYYNSGLVKIIKQDSTSGFLMSILSNVVIFVGYIQVFQLFLGKLITLGNTTFYMGAVSSFYGAVESFFAEFVAYRDFVLKVKDVYGFFQMEPKIKDGEYKLPRLVTPPTIELNKVSFHYPNNDIQILKNFSLSIKAGEKIAIVGENGAGKSTLVKLLARIYDPQEGEVMINDKNMKDIILDDWYKNLGILFQDYNFYGELDAQENIYIGKSMKPMDRDKMKEAAEGADAHSFIEKYPKKYNTIMSERFKEGIQPSKGQRQKIAIARFFYRDAPVAIFDEPTSAIDAESEYKIFNKIYKFFDNKTVIIISHRFSTVRNADRIVVLDQGRIVEEGSHQELLDMNGKYAQAFKKQAEGYL